jgi:hypothetical protein
MGDQTAYLVSGSRYRTSLMAMTPSPTQVIFDFITGDFEDAWNALAMVPTDLNSPWRLTHRCNYFFGMQTMVFLEWICRLCKSDGTGQALQDFSNELNSVEPHYFTQIPNRCRIPGGLPGGFNLPSVGGLPSDQLLLSMLFDLLRNGLAHRYEQIIVPLIGGELGIALYGVEPNHWLQTVVQFRATHHLSYRLIQGDIIVNIHPAILFLDLKAAFKNARLADPVRCLTPDPFRRGGQGSRPSHITKRFSQVEYQTSPRDLEVALRSAGLVATP